MPRCTLSCSHWLAFRGGGQVWCGLLDVMALLTTTSTICLDHLVAVPTVALINQGFNTAVVKVLQGSSSITLGPGGRFSLGPHVKVNRAWQFVINCLDQESHTMDVRLPNAWPGYLMLSKFSHLIQFQPFCWHVQLLHGPLPGDVASPLLPSLWLGMWSRTALPVATVPKRFLCLINMTLPHAGLWKHSTSCQCRPQFRLQSFLCPWSLCIAWPPSFVSPHILLWDLWGGAIGYWLVIWNCPYLRSYLHPLAASDGSCQSIQNFQYFSQRHKHEYCFFFVFM